MITPIYMNKDIRLSYLIITKNKLPYLRVILEKLLTEKKEDEEILVGDGLSTDGTRKYLEEMKQKGLIEHFISESDYSVAHAMNKLVLMAHGTLLKFITDDDAFSYGAIAACKAFMLTHSDIDIVNTEGGVLHTPSQNFRKEDPLKVVRALRYVDDYREWQKNHKPFSFCELGMMFRRSSIPLIGLRDPSFHRADAEFSLRVSAGKAKIAWYNSYSYVNIMNPQSVSLTKMKEMKLEMDRLNKFYLAKNPDPFVIEKLKIARNKLRIYLASKKRKALTDFDTKWPDLMRVAEKWMEIKNAEIKPEFIY